MTARLYLAPDSYGDPTIWRDTGHDRDEAVLTRTGGNGPAFDALAGMVAKVERVEALVEGWARDVRTLRDDAIRDEDIEADWHASTRQQHLDLLTAALTDGATR